MTCIVNPNQYPTKKALREHITAGKPVTIDDPSIFNPRSFYASDLAEGEEVVVTNHPKRSWFAQVGRRNGKLYVK